MLWMYTPAYAAAPNLIWACRRSTQFEEGRAVATDASGNVYMTGYFSGT